MKRVLFTAALGLCALAGCSSTRAPDAAEPQPNVIVIMTGDQGYGDFSYHGNPVLRTPQMDMLARESIRFTDFHAAPSCTPTRGALMTGLDALRNGASSATGQRHLLKRHLQTMAEVFRQNGYRTAMYGKWHLGGNTPGYRPHERGFEDAVYYLRGSVQSSPNQWNSDLFDDYLLHNGAYEQYPGYATDVWFDLGTEFVKERKAAGEPFFLYLALNAPHGPLLVPDEYRDPYRDLDKETATFFAMIETVDERLGDFVQMLDNEGLRDNTLLIFLTDNGTANGEKVFNAGMRGKKGSLYEGGHRVPLWISWPGGDLRPPGDVEALAQVQDLLPTLIDLCGLRQEQRPEYDGTGLAPLLRAEKQPVLDERMLVIQHHEEKGNALVMWRKWRWVEGELYNVAADPSQKSNVAAENSDIASRMAAHYERWWQDIEPELGLEPYPIGVDGEEEMLTAYDWWYGPRVSNWPHLRRGQQGHGRYEIDITRPGRYQISLRRWPRESGLAIQEAAPRYVPPDPYLAGDERTEPFPSGKALDIVKARVRFGKKEETKAVASEARQVTFEFDLEKGRTTLQTWFTDRSGEEFGAYYAYIARVDGTAAAEWHTPIEVGFAGVERQDAVVEADVDLPAGVTPLRLVEVGRGPVAFQADRDPDTGGTLLTFLLPGLSAADEVRRFELVSEAGAQADIKIKPHVRVEEIAAYQREPTFKVSTSQADYFYHVGGSAFASIIDRDGNDWVSYQVRGRFRGHYRGLPNLAPPQFHPGRPEGKKPSRLLRSGPLRVSILSETEDGAWRLAWDFFPSYARMTLLKKGPEPYWLLYEGTPGGSFDVKSDFWLNSAGDEMPLAPEGERWNGLLPAPQWVLFGDRKVQRFLFLALDHSDEYPDEFWHRGSGGMTVFGFGRGPRPQWQYLEQVPLRLTIGFTSTRDFDEARKVVESAWRPLEVRVGTTRESQ